MPNNQIEKLSLDSFLINKRITIEFVLSEALQMDGCVVGQVVEGKSTPELIENFGSIIDKDIEEYEREAE